ncbi:sacsin N-terminal ATP-binding-like domain-containing protein [Carboxydichorda subterranea]|uniref:sacsin N-terminal ATP-binding-like domain-containing protein n=1 Tax=Carboxydichorda subterranea TaxID=3109565 RepID=UPI003857D88F
MAKSAVFQVAIDNADDAGSKSVLVELARDAVRIANDGAPFSEADVESICRVGRSGKKATDYIGYLGVGCKSVFLFCDSPRIVSGCYRFAFDRQYWPQPEKVPWQITPVWLERAPEWTKELSSYTTFFELPFREGNRADVAARLAEEMKPDSLSGRVLLFLRHVEELVLQDRLRGARRVVRRRRAEPGEAGPGLYEQYEIQEERDGDASRERWVVFRATVRVPEAVRSDPETRQWERHEVSAREIAVAFALDETGQLRPVHGTAHTGVFSFLPLKEVPSGLSFLVHGDFLTGPGRESLRRDARWNRWMAGELFRFIAERVAPALLEHQRWRYAAAAMLYPGAGGPHVINDELLRPLRRYVEERPLLVSADGSLVTAAQAMRIPNWDAGWLQVLGVERLEAAFPGKRALHRLTLLPPVPVMEGPFVNSRNWPWAMEQLVEARAKEQDVELFRALYRELGRYSEGTIRSAPWFSARLVLTEDGSLVSASAAYWAEHGPPALRGRRRVHPGLWADPECAGFLEFLGCRVLTAQQVREWQLGDSLDQVAQAWATMPESERVEWTGRLFRLWREGVLDGGRLGFLTVRCRDGRWRSPREVFFGEAYAPEHRLEALAARGLLRVEPEAMPLLSEAYLAAGGGGEVSEWRRFFQALGVNRRLEDERLREAFAERVAEAVLVRYERSRGRQPERVPRSQERGYDFESGGRRIELKGRSRPDPPIDLTRTQYQALSDEAHYVYVVADALSHPVLYVLRGPKLLGLLPEPTFRYAEWRGLVEDRYVSLEEEGDAGHAESS